MVGGDSFGGLLDLGCDGAVVLLKVLGVLQDAVEVFLPRKGLKLGSLSHFLSYGFIFSSVTF